MPLGERRRIAAGLCAQGRYEAEQRNLLEVVAVNDAVFQDEFHAFEFPDIRERVAGNGGANQDEREHAC